MSSNVSKEDRGFKLYDRIGQAVWPDYRGDKASGAWFGDEFLKRRTVEKMAQHREKDEIISGFYQAGWLVGAHEDEVDADPEYAFKGCLVGCTLPPMNNKWVDSLSSGPMYPFDQYGNVGVWHVLTERFYNIQAEIAGALDDAFESNYDDRAEFAVEALEAIPVGAVYGKTQIDELEDVEGDDFLDILRNPAEIVGTR